MFLHGCFPFARSSLQELPLLWAGDGVRLSPGVSSNFSWGELHHAGGALRKAAMAYLCFDCLFLPLCVFYRQKGLSEREGSWRRRQSSWLNKRSWRGFTKHRWECSLQMSPLSPKSDLWVQGYPKWALHLPSLLSVAHCPLCWNSPSQQQQEEGPCGRALHLSGAQIHVSLQRS